MNVTDIMAYESEETMAHEQGELMVSDTLHWTLQSLVLRDTWDFQKEVRGVVEIKHRLKPHSWYENRDWRDSTARILSGQAERQTTVKVSVSFIKEGADWMMVVSCLGEYSPSDQTDIKH